MSLPKVGVEAVVDNANGYLKSIKQIIDANESAGDSVKGTAKDFDVLNDTTDYARSVQKRYSESLKAIRSALDDTGKSTDFFKEAIAAAAVAVDLSIGVFKAVGSAIGFVGDIIGGVIRKVAELGKNIFDTGVNFSQIMANIGAVTKKSGEDMRDLSNELIQLGMDSVAGPTAVADAYYDIASGVQAAGAQMYILKQAIKVAEAGQADLKVATQGLVTVFNAYDYGLQEITQASDILTRTTDLGTRTMQEYITAISPIAGIAASQKVGFDELGAAMAFMTKKGLTAGQSATALQGIMTQLARNTPGVTRALKAMGETSIEASIQNHGLAGTLKLLQDGAKKTGQNLQQLVGRVEAMKAVTMLGTEEFNKFFKTFNEGLDEATSKSREIQRLDVSAQLQLVNARFEGISLLVSQTVLPSVAKFLKFLNDGLAKIDWKKVSAGLDKVAEKLGASITKLGEKFTAWLDGIDWDKFSSDVQAAFENVAAWIDAIDWDAVGVGIQNFIAGIQQAFSSVETGMADAQESFNVITKAVQDVMNVVWTLANGFGDILSAGIENGRAIVEGAVQHVKDGVNGIWMSLFGPEGSISTAVNDTWPRVVEFLTTAKTNVEAGITGIVDGVKGIWEGLFGPAGRITTAVDEAWTAVTTAIDTARATVEGAVQGIIDGLALVWNGFWDGLAGKVAAAWAAVENAVRAAAGAVGAAFAVVAGAITSALAPVLAAIDSIKNFLGGGGGGTMSGASGGMGGGGGGGGGGAIDFGAKGGTLQEGLNIVGEKGVEAIVKHGSKSVVVSHEKTAGLLASMGSSMTKSMPGAGGIALSAAKQMLQASGGGKQAPIVVPVPVIPPMDFMKAVMTSQVMPGAWARAGRALPAPMPVGGNSSSSSVVNNRNIDTININNVPNAESAIRRFSRLQAGTRRR